MYSKYSSVVPKQWLSNNKSKDESSTTEERSHALKPYHHVRLDQEFKTDCRIWLDFLTNTSMINVVSRPMVDLLGPAKTSDEIRFYSDASGSKKLGYGCLLNTSWLYGSWDEKFILEKKPSIEYLELFALAAGILTWERRITNGRFTIFCDNEAVVQIINSLSSSCKNCMKLIRILTLNGLRYNRRISAKYVSTKANFLADALSRGQLSRFRRLGPEMTEFPDVIHDSLWPISKIWID